MEDSVYTYRKDDFITKRPIVEVNDEPTYTRSSSKVSKRSRSGRRGKARGGRSVTIKQGQTLSEIAKRNGTTVAKLKRLNGIKGNNIRAGKKLRVR